MTYHKSLGAFGMPITSGPIETIGMNTANPTITPVVDSGDGLLDLLHQGVNTLNTPSAGASASGSGSSFDVGSFFSNLFKPAQQAPYPQMYSSTGPSMTTMLLIGGVAIGAVILLMKKKA